MIDWEKVMYALHERSLERFDQASKEDSSSKKRELNQLAGMIARDQAYALSAGLKEDREETS